MGDLSRNLTFEQKKQILTQAAIDRGKQKNQLSQATGTSGSTGTKYIGSQKVTEIKDYGTFRDVTLESGETIRQTKSAEAIVKDATADKTDPVFQKAQAELKPETVQRAQENIQAEKQTDFSAPRTQLTVTETSPGKTPIVSSFLLPRGITVSEKGDLQRIPKQTPSIIPRLVEPAKEEKPQVEFLTKKEVEERIGASITEEAYKQYLKQNFPDYERTVNLGFKKDNTRFAYAPLGQIFSKEPKARVFIAKDYEGKMQIIGKPSNLANLRVFEGTMTKEKLESLSGKKMTQEEYDYQMQFLPSTFSEVQTEFRPTQTWWGGAAAGAVAGSVFGPEGTIVGGVGGAFIGSRFENKQAGIWVPMDVRTPGQKVKAFATSFLPGAIAGGVTTAGLGTGQLALSAYGKKTAAAGLGLAVAGAGLVFEGGRRTLRGLEFQKKYGAFFEGFTLEEQLNPVESIGMTAGFMAGAGIAGSAFAASSAKASNKYFSDQERKMFKSTTARAGVFTEKVIGDKTIARGEIATLSTKTFDEGLSSSFAKSFRQGLPATETPESLRVSYFDAQATTKGKQTLFKISGYDQGLKPVNIAGSVTSFKTNNPKVSLFEGASVTSFQDPNRGLTFTRFAGTTKKLSTKKDFFEMTAAKLLDYEGEQFGILRRARGESTILRSYSDVNQISFNLVKKTSKTGSSELIGKFEEPTKFRTSQREIPTEKIKFNFETKQFYKFGKGSSIFKPTQQPKQTNVLPAIKSLETASTNEPLSQTQKTVQMQERLNTISAGIPKSIIQPTGQLKQRTSFSAPLFLVSPTKTQTKTTTSFLPPFVQKSYTKQIAIALPKTVQKTKYLDVQEQRQKQVSVFKDLQEQRQAPTNINKNIQTQTIVPSIVESGKTITPSPIGFSSSSFVFAGLPQTATSASPSGGGNLFSSGFGRRGKPTTKKKYYVPDLAGLFLKKPLRKKPKAGVFGYALAVRPQILGKTYKYKKNKKSR